MEEALVPIISGRGILCWHRNNYLSSVETGCFIEKEILLKRGK